MNDDIVTGFMLFLLQWSPLQRFLIGAVAFAMLGGLATMLIPSLWQKGSQKSSIQTHGRTFVKVAPGGRFDGVHIDNSHISGFSKVFDVEGTLKDARIKDSTVKSSSQADDGQPH